MLQFLPLFWHAADLPLSSRVRVWRSYFNLPFADKELQCHGHILCSFNLFLGLLDLSSHDLSGGGVLHESRS